MPCFFFHVHDGSDLKDDEGAVLDNREVAQHEAIRIAADIISDNAKKMKLGEAWAMEVLDEAGRLIFRLDFRVGGPTAIHGQ
jgi:hypothetical protein